MTLREIDDSLPEGLHDGEVQKLTYNLLEGAVTLDLSIYVRGSDDPLSNQGGIYRDARLSFEQALYFALDPPIELLNDQLHILSFEVELLTESGSPAQLPPIRTYSSSSLNIA